MEDSVPGCFKGLRTLFSARKDCAGSCSKKTYNSFSEPQQEAKIDEYHLHHTIPCAFSTTDSKDLWALNKAEEPSPPPYGASSSSQTLYRPEILETIENELDTLNSALRSLNLKIHNHPETAFKEYFAHDILTEFMQAHGFKIAPALTGLETAWRAEWSYGEGGRTLGINSEMDALPGIGHACGHNLIAVSGVGVALATKAALEAHKIPGKVVLLGTPAEEGGGGKALLLKRGAYADMDACVMCHPAPGPKNSVALGGSLATQPLKVEYFGHSAHAAASPWEGQNALDAAVLAYSSVSMLRQQIKPDCRVHGIIEGRDWAANIIPDYAKMQWVVRAPSVTELAVLVKRVKACIEAAALAAACRIEISEGVAYHELRQNSVMEQEFHGIANDRYGMVTQYNGTSASTDFGNVTYALPAFHPCFAIPTVPSGGNHTAEFTNAAKTREAHNAAIQVSKALALVGVRVLDDDIFFSKVRESYEEMMKKDPEVAC